MLAAGRPQARPRNPGRNAAGFAYDPRTAMIRERGGRSGQADPQARQEAAAALAIAALGYLAAIPRPRALPRPHRHQSRRHQDCGASAGLPHGRARLCRGERGLAARRRRPRGRRTGGARQPRGMHCRAAIGSATCRDRGRLRPADKRAARLRAGRENCYSCPQLGSSMDEFQRLPRTKQEVSTIWDERCRENSSYPYRCWCWPAGGLIYARPRGRRADVRRHPGPAAIRPPGQALDRRTANGRPTAPT